jgi:outer membrane protein OmpA-like peptidoglycan-associated protein
MPTRLPVLLALLLPLLLGIPSLRGQRLLTKQGAVRESDPVLTFSGNTLYFTRLAHPRNQSPENAADIWMRKRGADGEWERPLNPGSPINTFGKDRVLHVSVDENRLAVLREGPRTTLDVLERSGRNWRVAGSWPVPAEVSSPGELTFDANELRLIYVNDGDLYVRYAGARGEWSGPLPLTVLNTRAVERRPILASDGRTLFFRRAGRWQRQTEEDQPAEPLELDTRYRQLAAAPGILVTATNDLGEDERLFAMPNGHDLVPAGSITYAAATALPTPSDRPAGSLAGARLADPAVRERYLTNRLASQQRELNRLDELRRRSYTGIPSDDPERAALREKLQRVNENNGDTLPPTTNVAESTRARYARDLAELERMKEKFRRQQRERAGEPNLALPAVTGPQIEAVGSETPTAPSLDTSQLSATVRSSLRHPSAQSGAETTHFEQAYARQRREVEALRAQLAGLQAKSPEKQPVNTSEAGPDIETASGMQPLDLAFIPNTAYPNSRGYAALDELVGVVRASGTVVEIRVHTSRKLSARAAQLLSEERAVTIRDYLRQAGIATENFRVIGYGNHESAAGERVEFIAR